ncbi:MAG: DNA recombination protein RmuC [Flavobacteriaceae bacterium]|jgi:DNA recombination protein RmuC
MIFSISLGIALVVLAVLFYLEKKKNTTTAQNLSTQESSLLLQQMNELQRSIDEKLGNSEKQMQESLKFQSTRSHDLIREITRELTEVKKTGEQMLQFGEQLQNLQDILKNPKQRGILGEYYLETTLKNVLPPKSYQMQYAFANKEIVDAVVFVKDKIIPIDSKFSLENYNRLLSEKSKTERALLEKSFKQDIKNRIDETSKYIRPEENTMDFAFMFIPHEAIYYDLLVAEIGGIKVNTQDLIQYAFSKNVLIVSPTSFLAFLQTVMQGLRALQIEESAKEIRKRVGELGRHISAYESFHSKVGNTLSTTVNHYNSASKELKKIDKDVTRIDGESIGLDIETISKPELE